MKKLEKLEITARQLEPGASLRNELTRKAADYVDRFIEGLPTSAAFKEGECSKLHTQNIEEQGKSFDRLLTILEDEVDTIGINSASGAHLGYLPGGGLWISAIADMLVAATNRYAGIAYSSPGAVAIENQMIRWLCSVVGYPETAHGNLSSGGSVANLIAIKATRDFHKINSTNRRKAVIYVTKRTHHCINKALNMTGLHEAVLRLIPMNACYQMGANVAAPAFSRN